LEGVFRVLEANEDGTVDTADIEALDAQGRLLGQLSGHEGRVALETWLAYFQGLAIDRGVGRTQGFINSLDMQTMKPGWRARSPHRKNTKQEPPPPPPGSAPPSGGAGPGAPEGWGRLRLGGGSRVDSSPGGQAPDRPRSRAGSRAGVPSLDFTRLKTPDSTQRPATFEELDTNGDGVIDREEWASANRGGCSGRKLPVPPLPPRMPHSPVPGGAMQELSQKLSGPVGSASPRLVFSPRSQLRHFPEGMKPDATTMLRRTQNLWQVATGHNAQLLSATASFAQLEALWHRMAAYVPGALAHTSTAKEGARRMCQDGCMYFPAFLRLLTCQPWHLLLILEKQAKAPLVQMPEGALTPRDTSPGKEKPGDKGSALRALSPPREMAQFF